MNMLATLSLVLPAIASIAATACVTEDLSTDSHALALDSRAVAFVGPGTAWSDAANWSTGRVPTAADDVVLDGTDDVIITGDHIQIRDLVVREAARLEIVRGGILETQSESIADDGQVIYRASGGIGGTLTMDNTTECTGCGGIKLNPTPHSIRTVVLKSSVTDMGLGGTTAARITRDATGAVQLAGGIGHYSTLTADSVTLGGALAISLYYGFAPRPGDRFQIVTAGRRTGEFANLPEGALAACTDAGVCLRISYRGGDGNDVTLTAE